MSFRCDAISVGVFVGPWESGHVAKDGAMLAFAEVEAAVKNFLGRGRRPNGVTYRVTELDVSLFLTEEPWAALDGLDIVFSNCGPLTALLLAARARARLSFSVIREVRTLGWIGYAFQEFVAAALARPGDMCTHSSAFAHDVWTRFRGDGNDVVYDPLLWRAPARPVAPPSRPLRCGFFSRVSRDKGFGYVPEIIARMQAAGWPVESLAVCGSREDGDLMDAVGARLSALGVAMHKHGEVDHARTLALMAGVDVVLFPSVSSFESFGRVVAEAYNLGKKVIASDFCGGRDLVTPAFRLPLALDAATQGAMDTPFEVGRLDLEGWRMPEWDAPNYRVEVCETYRASEDALLEVLDGAEPGPQRKAGRGAGTMPAPLAMEIDWDPFTDRSAEAWCEAALLRLRDTVRGRDDLLDLGGAMKRSLRAVGFAPTVAFSENRSPRFDAPSCREQPIASEPA